MLDFAQARRMMVDCQLRTFDVHDIPLLAAVDEIPRERFVPPGLESLAYSDRDIPVCDGLAGTEPSFMLKPMVLARMIQALAIEPGATALDVACGLGYGSAILARLGAVVTALESSDAAAAAAREGLTSASVAGVTVVSGPLEKGYPERALYDAILINGLVGTMPRALLEQLAEGGRLVSIERRGNAGRAVRYVRSGNSFGSRAIFDASAPALAAFKAHPGFVF